MRWRSSCQPEALPGLMKAQLAGRLFLCLPQEHLNTLILNLAKLTRFDIKGAGSSVKLKLVFVNWTGSKPGRQASVSSAAPHRAQPRAALLFISVICSEECWQLHHHPQLSHLPLRPLQGYCNTEQTGYEPAVVQRHLLLHFVHFPANPAVTSSAESRNVDGVTGAFLILP